jgi:hypothetical protein
MVVRARLGGQGVRVDAAPLQVWAYDLERRFSAQPRRESLIWGGSRAPRLPTADEQDCGDDGEGSDE